MKLQLKRSVVLDGGKAKEPTASQRDYGELAINYNADDPVLFMKTSDNEVIRVTAIGIPDIEDPTYQPGTLDERFVNLDGDTMTGYLVLNAEPTIDLHAATKKYVDDSLTASVPPSTEVNQSPPDSPVEGQLWWDTTDGRLYVYYEDLDSAQWVAAHLKVRTHRIQLPQMVD